jgi:hypothetical protein
VSASDSPRTIWGSSSMIRIFFRWTAKASRS